MKKCAILILLLYFFPGVSSTSTAQQIQALDSLVALTQTLPDNETKLHIYDEMFAYVNVYPNLIKSHLDDAIKLANKLNDRYLEMVFQAGTGKTYFELGDHQTALTYYLKAESTAESIKEHDYLIEIYSLISSMFITLTNYDKAEEYLTKEQQLITQYAADNDNAYANYFSKKARLHFAKNNVDSSLYYLFEVAKISKKNADHSEDETRLYANDVRNIATMYMAKGNYDKAKIHLELCKVTLDTMKNQDNNIKSYLRLYQNLGELFINIKKYKQSVAMLHKSLDYAITVDHLDGQMHAYKSLAIAFDSLKDYQAELHYLKKYHLLKDSIYSSDKQIKLNELETSYQLEKKNTILAQKEAEMEKEKSIKNISIVVAIAVFIGLIALLLVYKRIKTKNRLLSDQNTQINNQKNELEKLHLLKNKMFSIVSHDLRNPINTLRTYFTLIKNQDISAEKNKKYFLQIEQSVTQTGNLMDNLLVWAQLQWNNKKTDFTDVDTQEVVENILAEVQSQAALKNITFYKNLTPLNVHSSSSILEIAIRNIVTNAIKYSHPDGIIHINTYETNDQTIISIQDFGIGMSPEQIAQIKNSTMNSKAGTSGEKGSGMGLLLIIQLLEEINIHLEMESVLQKGSTFFLHINR